MFPLVFNSQRRMKLCRCRSAAFNEPLIHSPVNRRTIWQVGTKIHAKKPAAVPLSPSLPWEAAVSYGPVLAPTVQPTLYSHNQLHLLHYNIRWSVYIKKFVVMLKFKRPSIVLFRSNVQHLPEFSDTSNAYSCLRSDQVSQIDRANGKMTKHNRIICLYVPGISMSEIRQQLSA